MNKSLTASIVVLFLLLGGVAGGMYARRNQSQTAQTQRALYASMVLPANSLQSPRTYNQTLVESIDTDAMVVALKAGGTPGVESIKFDVLPDSFNVQTTVGLASALNSAQAQTLAENTARYLQQQSSDLTSKLFGQEQRAVVIFTKLLPEESSLTQSPASATVYGLIAGGLFGLFLALALTDVPRRKGVASRE